MTFQAARLLSSLCVPASGGTLRVAFSGGADSTVLLHALSSLGEQLPAPLRALHVDHGLHPDAAHWREQCREACAHLKVPLDEFEVDAHPAPGQSPEQAARVARYAAFQGCMQAGDVVLTAHHRDDQAETLLLQLLRGTGVRGLAAMPSCAPFGSGYLCRPLLGVSRQSLLDYARAHQLSWIDDPSNFDTDLNRNFLRHRALPLLRERWPGLDGVLARSAGHFADSARLLDELAEQDLERCAAGADTLSVAALVTLSPRRCRNLLRYWLRAMGLAVPDSRHLQRILDEVLPAAADSAPLVAWGGVEVRRYAGRLYAMPALAAIAEASLSWDLQAPLRLGDLGRLVVREGLGGGLRLGCRGRVVEVRFRQGGERCRLPGRAHSHSLKKLLQAAEVPPWQRARLPLVYVDGELAAVAGLWICEPFRADDDELGILLDWEPSTIETEPQKKDN